MPSTWAGANFHNLLQPWHPAWYGGTISGCEWNKSKSMLVHSLCVCLFVGRYPRSFCSWLCAAAKMPGGKNAWGRRMLIWLFLFLPQCAKKSENLLTPNRNRIFAIVIRCRPGERNDSISDSYFYPYLLLASFGKAWAQAEYVWLIVDSSRVVRWRRVVDQSLDYDNSSW